MKPIHFRYQYIFFIMLAGCGILYLFFQPLPGASQNYTLCLFHQLTGLPCPACGTGRGMVCILHGEFLQAWMFNPFSFIVLAFGLMAVTWMLFDMTRNQFTLIPTMKKPVPAKYFIVPLILVLINWYWNFVKGL